MWWLIKAIVFINCYGYNFIVQFMKRRKQTDLWMTNQKKNNSLRNLTIKQVLILHRSIHILELMWIKQLNKCFKQLHKLKARGWICSKAISSMLLVLMSICVVDHLAIW